MRNKRSKLGLSNGALNLILCSGSVVVDLLFYVPSIVCGFFVLVFVLKHKNCLARIEASYRMQCIVIEKQSNQIQILSWNKEKASRLKDSQS